MKTPTNTVRFRMVGVAEPVVAWVREYAQRLAGVVARQPDGLVSSPLGVWLVVALVAPAAVGARRAELEALLGVGAEEAAAVAVEFLSDPPSALMAAAALWVRPVARSPAVLEWSAGLPVALYQGPIPSQAEADGWAQLHTQGLIRRFPVGVDDTARVVLASALATKVSWVHPFNVVPSERLGLGSPLGAQVATVLADPGHGHMVIMQTEAAGLVGVHAAGADEGLTVVSVIAGTDVRREQVMVAAHDVAATLLGETVGARVVPLIDLPLGDGWAWTVAERPVSGPMRPDLSPRGRWFGRGRRPAASPESSSAVLPAWHGTGELDLLADPDFGAETALRALAAVLPTGLNALTARQVTTATYDRFGFEAAAVTAMASITGMLVTRPGRHLHLRFAHPFAVVAVLGTVPPTRSTPSPRRHEGLPVFDAWITHAMEPERPRP